jgi:glutaredoxin
MKLYKFENTGCPSCDRAKLFLSATGADKEIEIKSKMPNHDAESAILAGKLKRPLMSFPTFIVFDNEGKEVEGKRMDGFDTSRTGELLELVEFVKENK